MRTLPTTSGIPTISKIVKAYKSGPWAENVMITWTLPGTRTPEKLERAIRKHMNGFPSARKIEYEVTMNRGRCGTLPWSAHIIFYKDSQIHAEALHRIWQEMYDPEDSYISRIEDLRLRRKSLLAYYVENQRQPGAITFQGPHNRRWGKDGPESVRGRLRAILRQFKVQSRARGGASGAGAAAEAVGQGEA